MLKKQYTDKQKKNLMRLAELGDSGVVALVKHISDLEDDVDKKVKILNDAIAEIKKEAETAIGEAKKAVSVAEETKKMEGEPGHTPIKGVDYRDGEDYVLTDEDKKDIAGKIKVPVVEKVIEKTHEIVHETPVIRETIKETIKKDFSPQEIRDLLELLFEDERLDAKHIKGLPEVLKNLPEHDKAPMMHTPSILNLPDVQGVGITVGQTLVWKGFYFAPANVATGTWFVDQLLTRTNGTNYTLPSAPMSVLFLFLNGQKLTNSVDYTYTGTAITMTSPTISSDILIATYL